MEMLTTAKVRELKPRASMYEVTCAAMPGFTLRVLPTGKKVFVVRYRVDGKDVRERIGLWGTDLSVEEARRQAVLLARGGEVETGPPERTVTPRPSKPARRVEPVESRRSRVTVREVAERFLAEYINVYLKDGSARNYRHLLADVILPAFGDRAFDELSRNDAHSLHAKMKDTPGAADYMLCVLGSLYTRITEDWEMVDMRNPAHGIRRFGSRKIERFLTPEERRRLREVMDAGLRVPPGRRGHLEMASVWALQLLALTGLRRDEILDLHWPSVDWQHNCLRLVDTKTGPRTVPVSSQVMTLLRQIHGEAGSPKQGFVVHSRTGRKMTSLNATWTRLRVEAGIADVRLHDLRHSFASDALMGGVPLAIVGEMLGHREPATTKRYAHLADRVVREAIEHTTGRIVAAQETVTLALPTAPFVPMRDEQWAAVEHLVRPARRVGGKAVDYRKMLEGIRWVLHTGARWEDMPKVYGASTTCWRWYARFCESGAWPQIEALLQARPDVAPRRPRPRPRRGDENKAQ